MLKFFTKGFSHGDGYFCKVIGLPQGYFIDKDDIYKQLALRRDGVGRSTRMQLEKDEIFFLSGLDKSGKTDGNSLQFFIKNKDNTLAQKPPITALRSGHADWVACKKLGLDDARQVCELSSARRTVAYTAFGAICKQILAQKNVFTYSYVKQIGKVVCDKEIDFCLNKSVLDSPFRCPDKEKAIEMQREIFNVKEEGDSLGGKVCVGCVGLPVGMGDFVDYDGKLDGLIAKKMMSIPSVKAVEFGLGVGYADKKNTQVADVLAFKNGEICYKTNNCGGVVAGLSTGKEIKVTLTVKPVPTTKKSLSTIDIKTGKDVLSHYERSDTCVVSSVGVIAENILASLILDQLEFFENSVVEYSAFDKINFADNTIFVVDKNVLPKLNLSTDRVFVIDNGEDDKNLDKAVQLLHFLDKFNISKTDCLVAIGGGAVIDLAGFVASIYKRGVRLISVPTTLLAMVDAGHGGKNAINFGGVKNTVGTFYSAEKILMDFSFLDTNTQENYKEGFGEIVKCSFFDSNIFKALKDNPTDTISLIKLCVNFKHRVVNADLYDDFWRRQLNAGHTLGHAFEIFYGLPHGQAVLLGLFWEIKLAYFLEKISLDFYQEKSKFVTNFLDNNVKNIFKPTDYKKIVELCGGDKKNQDNKIGFVLVQPYDDFSFEWLTSQRLEEFFEDVFK